MRHEVLYQYDLPIEVLDDIPRTEEVLEVVFARSKENYLVPILFTRLRILWAYPETSVTYRLFEMNYADLLQVHVKFTMGLATVMTIANITGDKNVFNGVKNTAEEMRAALLTLRDVMAERLRSEWKFLHKQNLFVDEYLLKESDAVLDAVPRISAEDLFEDKEMPGIGCYEPTEKLFHHFPAASADDVFEDQPEASAAAEEESMSSAMVSRIARMVESTEPEREPEVLETPLNDVTVFDGSSGMSDEQWNNEGKGDAMILPGSGPAARAVMGGGRLARLAEEPSVSPVPEEDDSEVYVTERGTGSSRKEEEAAAVISGELDRLPVPEKVPEVSVPKSPLPTPLPRPAAVPGKAAGGKPELALSITLEPRESFDDAVIDKCLEDLKFLRDNGVFSEAEYKERCLRLFKRTGL